MLATTGTNQHNARCDGYRDRSARAAASDAALPSHPCRARLPAGRRRPVIEASSTQVQRLPHGGRRRQQQAGSQPPASSGTRRARSRATTTPGLQECGRDLGRRGHGRLAEGAEEVHQGRDSGVIYRRLRDSDTLPPCSMKMVFAGIKKEKERGELIKYLKEATA